MTSTPDIWEGIPQEDVSGPTEGLNKNTSIEELRWPRDLGENNQPYMTFRVAKYRRRKREELSKKNTIASVHLPIPANLQKNIASNYNNVELGLGGNIIRNSTELTNASRQLLTGSLHGAISSAEQAASGDLSQVKSAIGTGVVRNLVQKVGELTNTRALEAAQVATGMAINPHLAALFQGVAFRQHNFTYKMVARDTEESNIIKRLISIFEYAMHPGLTERSNLFTFPDEFYLEFARPYREYLFEFQPCVLTNMTVNYNGQNIPAFFEDTKAPVDIEINLTFSETEIITKEKLKKEISRKGIERNNN